jgi:sulfur-carrier protein adenylyltransferase/sulfurtransferase
MRDINPNVRIDKYDVALTSENALDIHADTTWWSTARIISPRATGQRRLRAAEEAERVRVDFPLRGAGHGVRVSGRPVLRCLYPEPPPPGLVPSCAEGGVLGILPGTIGLIQATEAVKLILGVGEPLVGTAVAVRRAGHALPRAEAAPQSGMPGVRRPSHDDEN